MHKAKLEVDYSLPIKWMKWSLAISFILTGVKFTAWFLTHSNAIFSDAIESLVNIIAGVLGLYSIWLAAKPSDPEHPYGHGKVEFISSAIEGILVLLAGVLIIKEGISHLIHPNAIEQLNLGILFISVSTASHFAIGAFLIKKGKLFHSPTLEANGRHLRSDAMTSLALIIGLVSIKLTNLIWIDNVVALAFGLYIIKEGFEIIRKSVGGIMDETDTAIVEQLLTILNANRRENWIDIHNFRVIKYGSVLHIDCHMTLPWYITNKESHDEVDALDRLINSQLERKIEFFIHVDPCIPSSCRICQVNSCKQRKSPQEEILIWDIESISKNAKHT